MLHFTVSILLMISNIKLVFIFVYLWLIFWWCPEKEVITLQLLPEADKLKTTVQNGTPKILKLVQLSIKLFLVFNVRNTNYYHQVIKWLQWIGLVWGSSFSCKQCEPKVYWAIHTSTICFTHFNWCLQFALPTLTDVYNLLYPL